MTNIENNSESCRFTEREMHEQVASRLQKIVGEDNKVEVKECFVTSAHIKVNGRDGTCDYIILFPRSYVELDMSGANPEERARKIMGDKSATHWL